MKFLCFLNKKMQNYSEIIAVYEVFRYDQSKRLSMLRNFEHITLTMIIPILNIYCFDIFSKKNRDSRI